jgi:hypothetical protein
MAAIMLTRKTVFDEDRPLAGWEVECAGELVATYAEEPDGGGLRLVEVFRLGRRLLACCGAYSHPALHRVLLRHALFGTVPSPAALGECYLRGAEAWEAREAPR